MIKKNKNKADILTRFGRYINIHDTDPMSRNYFRFSEFPDRLRLGKNMIRINANDKTLAIGSEIYIEFLDANGNALYHEVIDYIDKDKSRVIVVYVYEDTPIGEFTALFAARTSPIREKSDLSVPNLLWTSTGIIVPSQPTKSDVIFTKQPKIEFSEVKAAYLEVTSSVSRLYTKATYDPSVEVFDVGAPLQFSVSKEYETKFDSNTFIVKQPDTTTTTNGVSPERIDLPNDKRLSLIELSELRFEPDMIGSTVIFNDIDIRRFAPSDVTASLFDIGSVPAYSASVVRVLNTKKAYVYPPFKHIVEYTNNSGVKRIATFNKFIGANTTASYFVANTDATSPSTTSQSLFIANINNLEPAVGDVEKVRISFKGYGSLGEFEEFGTYPLEPKNAFINDGIYKTTNRFGVVEEEIGVFHKASIVDYWTSESYGNTQIIPPIWNRTTLINSIELAAKPLISETDYYVIRPKMEYAISASLDTEYIIRFDAYAEPTGSGNNTTRPQIDIYISGASVQSEPISYKKRNYRTPIKDKVNLGTYLGSVLGANNNYEFDNEFSFKLTEHKKVIPKFVIRQGNWNLSDIKVSPRKSIGFTPNQYKLIAPLTKIKKDTEYIFKVDYLSQEGRKANIQTEMYGVTFEGGNIVLNENDVISGSPWNPQQLGPGYWTASLSEGGIFYESLVSVGGENRDTSVDSGTVNVASQLFVSGSISGHDVATFYSPSTSGSIVTIMGKAAASERGSPALLFRNNEQTEISYVIGTTPASTEQFKIRGGFGFINADDDLGGTTFLRINSSGHTTIGGPIQFGWRLAVSGSTSLDDVTNNSEVADSHFTGSFSGSFVGDGSFLDGIASSPWTASINTSIYYDKGQVVIGNQTGSDGYTLSISGSITGSGNLTIAGNITASNGQFLGEITSSRHTGNLTLQDGKELTLTDTTESYAANVKTGAFFWSGVTIPFGSPQTNKLGDAMFITGNGQVRRSSADLSNAMPVGAMAIMSASEGIPNSYLVQGIVGKPNWSWKPGTAIYAQTQSAGGELGYITQTPPNQSGDIIQIIGIALTDNTIYFNPSYVTSSVP